MSASATTTEIPAFRAPAASGAAEVAARPAVAPMADAPAKLEHPAAPVEQELIIQPSSGWIGVDWGELWRFRELLYFLVWRDVKVRYKQAALGVAWAVLEPLMSMVIFTAIFGIAAGMRNNLPQDIPYAIFVFAALLPWKLFQTSLTTGGMSLVQQQNLLTKIYFPRLFVPTSTVGSALVDMALQFTVFLGILVWYQFVPSWQVVFVPFLILLVMMLSSGVAYLLSALTVTYRDFRFLIPVISQMWMWVSFVAFPAPRQITESPKWQILLTANPMYGIISAFRACITGNVEASGFKPVYLVSSIAGALAVLTLGLFYFRKTEKRFADIA